MRLMDIVMTLVFITGLILIGLGLSGCRPQHTTYINEKPGPQGLQGETGGSGSQGLPGIDSTPVTVVQLCPGVTTYPGVFVEVAICLQNKLYAVYSANGGFLVELVPGNYSSNAIGSSCSLTVAPNCVVSH